MLGSGTMLAARSGLALISLLAGLSGTVRAAGAPGSDSGSPLASFWVTSDQTEYFLGETVILHFNLRNEGLSPISLSEGGDYRGSTRAHRFSVEAVDSLGRKAVDPAPDDANMGGFIRNFAVRAGETHTESFSLSRYCRIEEPGVYRIRVHREGPWSDKRLPFPTREIVLTFRMPSPAEAERILDDLEAVRAGPAPRRGPQDYTSLQIPLFVEPLAARAAKGDAWALLALAHVARPEATAALVALARGTDASVALAAVEQLKRRLPWSWVMMEGPATHDQLVAASWDARLAPGLRTLAMGWLSSDDPRLVGAGADLLRSVGEREDDRLLFATLTRLLPATPTAGPNYRPPIEQLLGAVYGLQLRGYVFNERSLDQPGAVFAYLNSLRAKPEPRPPGWRKIFEESYESPIVLIREAALYSLPYPVPPECAAAVDSQRSDPDEGIRSAILFATERRIFIQTHGPDVPPVNVQLPISGANAK